IQARIVHAIRRPLARVIDAKAHHADHRARAVIVAAARDALAAVAERLVLRAHARLPPLAAATKALAGSRARVLRLDLADVPVRNDAALAHRTNDVAFDGRVRIVAALV